MDIRPVNNEEDYRAALQRIDELMDAAPGTAAGTELDILATLVDAYEARHFPIEAPNPVDAILFRMEQQGLSRKDLEKFLGSRGRVSDVLNRRRDLSISQIKKLHHGLRIPYENLLGNT